jgi:hypothetical protein
MSAAGDLERLGDLVGAPGSGLDKGPAADWPLERRLMEVWNGVVGPEVAGNATPASLRRGRLTVATSSSVWAQTLQLMGESLVQRLNEALGEVVVTAVVCRPAGWDPAGGPDGPRALRDQRPIEGGDAPAPARAAMLECPLTAEEEAAIAEVERGDLEPELRARIVRVMRAFFQQAHERQAPGSVARRRR